MMWLTLILFIPSVIYVHAASGDRTKAIFLDTTNSIVCEKGSKINIKQVDIIQTSRQCIPNEDICNLSVDADYILRNDCDKKLFCTIDMHDISTEPPNCLMNLGYFNLTYSCKRDAISCNFDTDWCGWLHTTTNTNKFRWEREQQNGYYKIPKRDHTTASLDGSYAYIYSEVSNKADVAQLYFENIASLTEQCFSFWYYISDTNHVLEVLKDDQRIFKVKRRNEQRWYNAIVPINTSVPTSQYMTSFTLAFKVIKAVRNTNGAFAVDDILLANKACADSLHECSFEDNTCYASTINIKQNYSWFRQQGRSKYDLTGPKTDHTTGSIYGHYMYLDSAHGSAGDIVYSQGPSVYVDEGSCLTFWYHMFGIEIGRLNVTLNKIMIWSVYEDKGDNWNLATIDIETLGYLTFEFVGIYGSGWESDIAVDDILLLPGCCSGLIDHKKMCVDLDYEDHAETNCPKGYLHVPDLNLSFNPEKRDDYCSRIYNQITTRLQKECENHTDSQKCLIDLSTDKSSHPECFQLYEFRILYSCEEEETSTVSSDITSTGYSSTVFETTTISSFTASREGTNTVSDGSVTLSRVMKNSSDSATGLVVGLVIGGVLLVCVVVVIVILIRRNTFSSDPREKITNNLRGNDYIGSQDIALPQTAVHSSHVQYFDNQTSNDVEYAIVNSTTETSFNENTDSRTAAYDSSYMVLDPTQTGFDRRTCSNTSKSNEFANRAKDTRNKIDDNDKYAISEGGEYDHSGSNRHKELEDNIYNHSVDTIYDSGSHIRNDEEREDTYDHFFGQKTEDEYDISLQN